MTAPRFGEDLIPVRRHPFVWRARRMSLSADTGQLGTLVAPSANPALDDVSTSLTIARQRARWQHTAFGVGLRLGANAGALAEYLKWPVPLAAMVGANAVPMCGLFDFVENGTDLNAGGASLGYLGASPGTPTPLMYWLTGSGPGAYAVVHQPSGPTSVNSSVATATGGDRVEFRWWLYADGSVQGWMSKNGGVEIVGARSSAAAIQAAWSSPTELWLNSVGASGTYGHNIFLNVAILRGNQSLAKLREAVA